jgi:hypothetical protein
VIIFDRIHTTHLQIFFPRSTKIEYRARKVRSNVTGKRASAGPPTQEESAVRVIPRTLKGPSIPPVKQTTSFISSIDNGGDDTVDESYNLPPRYEPYSYSQRSSHHWVNQESRHEQTDDHRLAGSTSVNNQSCLDTSVSLQPNRRVDAESAFGSSRQESVIGIRSVPEAIECELVHPLVRNFKSPIGEDFSIYYLFTKLIVMSATRSCTSGQRRSLTFWRWTTESSISSPYSLLLIVF